MDPIVGAILAAGVISSASSVYTNRQNIQHNTDRFSDQVNLANTAHQREVRDLKAAGLNPILSASGSGASVPTLGAAVQDNVGQGISEGINSAAHFASQQYKAEVESLRLANRAEQLNNSARKIDLNMKKGEETVTTISRAVKTIEDSARFEALTGKGTGPAADLINWRNKDAVKTYDNMVRMYRNKIQKGRYDASVHNSVIQNAKDVSSSVGNFVGLGTGSAKGMKSFKSKQKGGVK